MINVGFRAMLGINLVRNLAINLVFKHESMIITSSRLYFWLYFSRKCMIMLEIH